MINTSQPDSKWDWIGTIETATGRHVNLVYPSPETIHIEDISQSLSNICRFNGHVSTFYSVAEHSVRVAQWLMEQGYDNVTVLTGLLHDAAEAYVGDMMRPLKRIEEMERVFKPIEENLLKTIHLMLGGQFPHPDVIHQADRAVYEWEVANIRSGRITGMSPIEAQYNFLDCYETIVHSIIRDSTIASSTSVEELFRSLFAEEEQSFLDDLQEAQPTHGDCVNESLTNYRSMILGEANSLVNGDRNVQYGDPTEDFRRTSVYWSTHIGGVFRRKMHTLGYNCGDEVLRIIDSLLDSHDVAVMMGQLKHSRLAWDPYKKDTWADTVGYAACGYECAARDI